MKSSTILSSGLLLLCSVALLMPAMAKGGNSTSSASRLPVSQITITGKVATAGIEEKLRRSLATLVPSTWRKTQRKLDLGVLGSVGAVIHYQPKASRLRFSADAKGGLRIDVPISVRPEPNSSGLASLGVKTEGCGERDFVLSVRFTPKISGNSLTFSQKAPAANSGDYRCVIGPNTAGKIFTLGKVRSVDVASQIRAEIESRAKVLFTGAADQINGLLADDGKLGQMARLPVEFGSGIRLGIAFEGFRPLRLRGDGKQLQLDGVLSGRPWLDFGQKPAEAADPADVPAAGQGFHLPAVLLFPTATALLPTVESQQVSASKEGTFSLRPVPGRDDLVVLQRSGKDGRENVIWLSSVIGGSGQKQLRFEQPMTGVLDQILAWLNEPELWRDVPGVVELKIEVAAFRRLVEQFQQETSLPLDDRGMLHFSRLSLDLISVRVSKEAIWADVVLRGQARLDIAWPL